MTKRNILNHLKRIFTLTLLTSLICLSGYGQNIKGDAQKGQHLLFKMANTVISPDIKLTELTVSGEAVLQGQKMPMTMTIDYSDGSINQTIQGPMGEIKLNYQGGTGTMKVAGQERSMPPQMANGMETTLKRSFLNIAKNAGNVNPQFLGTEKVDGTTYNKLEVSVDSANVTILLDQETNYPDILRYRKFNPKVEKKVSIENRQFDWKVVEGVAYPYKQITYQNGEKASEINYNNHKVESEKTTQDKFKITSGQYSLDYISYLVKKKIEHWQQKREFETTEAYQQRVTEETRKQKLQEFKQEVIDSLGAREYDLNITKTNYDADNQTFQLMMADHRDLFLKVPLSEAKIFDKNAQKIVFTNPTFSLTDNGKIVLRKAKLTNPANNISYQYTADSDISFNTSELALNFEPIDVNIQTDNARPNVTRGTQKIEVGKADVDVNIPETEMQNKNAVAVVIGNQQYSGDTPDVKFAARDARVVKEYLIKTLGFRAANILYLENATKTRMEVLLGDEQTSGRLKDLVKPGVSDVYVFYSGHGAPNPNTNTSYLIPVDGDPSAISISGYSMDVLYNNLAKIEAQSIQVVIDACFSGATGRGQMLIQNASPIGIQVSNPLAKLDNGLVISAASGSQIASWYPEKRHGLLTYFYLKGLQGAADLNDDKKLTSSELAKYLTDQTDGIPYYARRLHSREQMPQIFMGNPNKVLVKYD